MSEFVSPEISFQSTSIFDIALDERELTSWFLNENATTQRSDTLSLCDTENL